MLFRSPTGNAQQQSDPVAPTINFEDLMARVRKEEKEKLYPKIEKLQKENKDLVTKNNSYLLKIGNLQAEIDSYKDKLTKSNSGDSEVVKTLKADLTKAREEIENYKKNSVNKEELEKSIRDQVSKEYEIKLYKESKLNELKGHIIPELVFGETKEEIDKSLEASKKRFEEIAKSLGVTPNANANSNNNMVNPNMNTNNGINPNALNGTTQFAQTIPSANVNTSNLATSDINFSDLASMDVRSPQYQEIRKKLGLV